MARIFYFKSDVYPECDGTPFEAKALQCEETGRSEEFKSQGADFRRICSTGIGMRYKESKRSHLFVIVAVKLPPCRCDGRRLSVDLPPRPHAWRLRCAAIQSRRPGQLCILAGWPGNLLHLESRSKSGACRQTTICGLFRLNRRTRAKNITAENKASDSTPLYSPDGKYIAYRAQQRPGYESDRFRLMLYDRKTGEKNEL